MTFHTCGGMLLVHLKLDDSWGNCVRIHGAELVLLSSSCNEGDCEPTQGCLLFEPEAGHLLQEVTEQLPP